MFEPPSRQGAKELGQGSLPVSPLSAAEPGVLASWRLAPWRRTSEHQDPSTDRGAERRQCVWTISPFGGEFAGTSCSHARYGVLPWPVVVPIENPSSSGPG